MGPLNPTLRKRPWLREEPDETMRVSVGVDLGQLRDPTAIVVVEAQARDSGRKEIAERLPDGTIWQRPIMETHYLVRHVERLPLRTPYRAVGRRVGDIVRRLKEIAGKRAVHLNVLADATGLGRPVVEEMREELGTGVPVSAVTITVGEKIVGGLGAPEVRVPKMILVSRVATLLQRGAVEAPPNLHEVRVEQDRQAQSDDEVVVKAGHRLSLEPPSPGPDLKGLQLIGEETGLVGLG